MTANRTLRDSEGELIPPLPSANLPSKPRYAGLDALRFFAATAVFVQHLQDHFAQVLARGCAALGPTLGAWVSSWMHHAHVGVDLFFVLSGCSLGLAFARKPVAPKAYIRARFFRIVPAFYVALLLALLGRKSMWNTGSFVPLALSASFVAGYLPPGASIINASWSLTTEVLFYALFPWIAERMCKAGRATWRQAFTWALGLSVIALSVRALCHHAFLGNGDNSFAFELTQRRLAFCRLDQFVLGILAARILSDRDLKIWRLPNVARGVLAACCLIGLLLVLKLEGNLYFTSMGAWPYVLIGPLLMGLVLLCAKWHIGPLAWLGERSYGFFLNHELVLGLALAALAHAMPQIREGNSLIGLAVGGGLAYALALGAGALSFATIEAWGRRMR